MDYSIIAPKVQEIFKEALEERRYPFGFAKYQGIGNKVASGSLKDSIKVVPKKDGLSIEMNDYGQFVQSGRLAGKKGVPISAIIKWIKDRKLKGRDKKGRYIKDVSFAFAIQTNIKKFGIKPSNWLDVAIENLLSDEEITNILADKTVEELINAIEGI